MRYLSALARWLTRPAPWQYEDCICLPYDIGMGFVKSNCPRYQDHLAGRFGPERD